MPEKTWGVRDRRGNYDGPTLVLVLVVIAAVAGFALAVAAVSVRSASNSGHAVAPRTQAELVPADVHVVRLTRCWSSEGLCVWPVTRIGRPRITVTGRAAVTRLRNAFNSLPFRRLGHAGPFGCDRSVTTVAFSRSITSPPALVASITCRLVTITYPPGASYQPEPENRALAKALEAADPALP